MKELETCELPDTTNVLEQLWDVLADPDCEQQEERKLVLLQAFFTVAEERIKLRDLQLVTKVLDVIAKKAEVDSKYERHVKKILDLLNAPIRMERSSDQLNFNGYLVELFTALGYILLRTANKSVQLQILDIILTNLLTKRIGDSDMIPVPQCVKALELSELAECLSDLIVISEDDVYSLTIFTTLQVSMMSKLICWTLLRKEVLESLLVGLMQIGNDDVAGNVYDLLWTLLTCTECVEDWQKIPQPSKIALKSLRSVLREQILTHCHPGKNRELLHNTAALTLKIINLFPSADYVLSGLIEDITIAATLSESVIEMHIVPFFKCKEDHVHFKKLMLACLAAAPVNAMSVGIFERYKLAECLVSMLRLDCCRSGLSWLSNSALSLGSDKSSMSYNSNLVWFNIDKEQSIDLFKSAVPVVCALYEALHKRFMRAGLINTLTTFLSVHYLQDKNHIDELFWMVIRTIFYTCFSKPNQTLVRKEFVKAGAVHILLGSCNILLVPINPLTIRAQSILCKILHVLSALMEGQPELQLNNQSKSMQIVKSLYHRITNPPPIDSVLDNRLIVAISNFAWVSLIKHEDNMSKFIDSSEMYSHLDILERSNSPTQSVYLSVLADIAESHKAVPYLVSWRGRKGVKFLSLLCQIWREEEMRLKVPRSEQGCITDIERPLMGEDQYRLSKAKSKYAAVCDMFGSCRPKIYALVQLLHRHEQVVSICEDHYRLGHDILPWEDQVTMQVIESYLPLKLGEVWWEIFHNQEDFVPLDRYLAQTLADRYLNWSLNVQKSQHGVLKQRCEHLEKEEQQYYSKVRSVRLADTLECLRQVTSIARTADRQMFLATQQELRECVEHSRPELPQDFHVAFPQDVRVLVVDPRAEVVLHESV
ncbi:cilia- and flagella-associated protein 69-like [Macrosteles quadrilineatus]|uniref:cilia- and flagella-associated protein 69-like n=1 Tax=Macrosteles quadrilineatus TaxID=74068 RepID=UPI0023E1622B|nr:cilia- and flagella-associated protein 69-like [Macrosteles quadrilineatus]